MLERNIVREAVRLFEGRVVSDAEADQLRQSRRSREEFLGELWFRRGSLARHPDLAALVERGRTFASFAGGRAERNAYERLLAGLDPREPAAIHVPRWIGVSNATRYLFRQTIPMPATTALHPDDLDAANVAAYADILLASRCRHFVISGGDRFHLALVRSVLQQDEGIRFDLMWHGNYAQLGEEQVWQLFQQWLRAHEAGQVTRIGVTKLGLDTFLRAMHVDAVHLPQFVPIDNDQVDAGEPQPIVGIWLSRSSSYLKLPHAMIAAVRAMPSFLLKAAGLGAEGLALVSALDVPFLQVLEEPISHERLMREMAQTAVSLYVTIAEAEGLLPIESLSVGVPCLIGPGSQLFRDHDLLRRLLVVEEPYNPGLIAEMALAAVSRRSELLSAYRGYNAEVEERASAALARFLA